jgi:hypothetical protein
MPSFKPKSTKKIKICKKYTTTLDGKHKEFISEFSKNECDIIPKLKLEKYQLKTQLTENTKLPIEQIMDIKDRIVEINETIKELNRNKKKYLLDNSKYVFEYFENKKNITNVDVATSANINTGSNTNTTNTNTNTNNTNNTTKNQLLINFFKIQNTSIDNSLNNNNNNNNNSNNNEQSQSTENVNKNIVQKYLCNIDESFLDMNSFVRVTDICQNCYKGELIPLDDEGVLICNLCAVNIPYLIENEKPSYKEPPKEVCFYAYKKINHFKEILAQFQGKETTQIPNDVIDQIHLQIKKERISLDHLTHHKTKEILKKLGFNKYYEHIAFIKNKLGIKPPIFSPELEETLCNLFMETQAPYAKTCPDYRVNFLNYYYVLFKFCELLGEEQYLDSIPLLKDREKLIEQDETWKKMCIELNWEFIATV